MNEKVPSPEYNERRHDESSKQKKDAIDLRQSTK